MRILLIIISFLIASVSGWDTCLAQCQTLEWGKSFTGYSNGPKTVVTDSQGNVYVGGYYQGNIDLDPSSGAGSFSSGTAFIGKFDGSGVLLWSVTLEGTAVSYQSINGMNLDDQGNIIVCGQFGDTTDFDPTGGVSQLVSNGSSDIFLAKYDGNGSLIWVQRMGGIGSDYGTDVSTDDNGGIYVTGAFRNIACFDPLDQSVKDTSNGSADIFIAKYDANGVFEWVHTFGTPDIDQGIDIEVGNDGYVLLSGGFPFIASPVLITPTDSISETGFFAKYDPSGNLVWVRGLNVGHEISLSTDASNNVYLTGFLFGTQDFDPSAADYSLTSNGDIDIFLAKYNDAGDLEWARSFGSADPDGGNSVYADSDGNVVFSGSFAGSVDFDPMGSGNVLVSAGYADQPFLAKYSNTGDHIWAFALGCSYSGIGMCVNEDVDGNLILSGTFIDTLDVDPSAGVVELISSFSSSSNTFLAKYSDCLSGVSEQAENEDLLVYPNPFTDNITVQINASFKGGSLEVYTITGELIYSEILKNKEVFSLVPGSMAPGMYQLVLTNTTQRISLPIVKY